MIHRLLQRQIAITLVLVFSLAVFLRFLFFPDNIYFGFDQARDAFESQGILKGEFKIIGPTTSIPGLNHGALFYYLYAVIYFISGSDPAGMAVFLRLYNALGVFLIFFTAIALFKRERFKKQAKWVGIISAILFAFSYEQTQYALFMTHPALAVITVLLFYLGLALFLFKEKDYGIVLAALGLGLSFQFHFLLAYLIIALVLNLAIFRKSIPRLNWKIILAAFGAFLFSISTFIVAEIRFNFKTVKNLTKILQNPDSTGTALGGTGSMLLAAKRYIDDNLFAVSGFEGVLLLALLVFSIFLIWKKEVRGQIIFLLIWFGVGLSSYFMNDTSLYFYGVGTSISLLILAAFLIVYISGKSKILGAILLLVITASNIYLIFQNNPHGPNKEINVQVGMLLEDEKRAIDYIYSKAAGEPFAVNAFTMPLNINTTWAYLFEWYGKKKYGYLPVWGGINAPGYPGELEVNNSRSTLPEKRFLIMEPIRGSESVLGAFITEESWFTDIIEEERFGEITVDFQKPK